MSATREEPIEIPTSWHALEARPLPGLVMVLGATDVGKSTLVSHLAKRWAEAGHALARLDGDPGQARLGPPTTMTLEMRISGKALCRRVFVGDVTPAGHMLPLLVGAAKLVQAAREAGAETILYDTTGLIDPRQGGAHLKWSKIDLLRPSALITLEKARELELILTPLRQRGWPEIIPLKAAMAARRRSIEERRRGREAAFRCTFEGATRLVLDLRSVAVFPAANLDPNRLVALEDDRGWLVGLGRVEAWDEPLRRLSLWTPVPSLEGVRTLRVGDLLFEGRSFRHRRAAARFA